MIRRIALALTAVVALSACHSRPGKAAEKAPADQNANAAFMTNNSKQPGVVTLPDGLQYKITKSGPADGVRPRATDEVKVNYEGKLLSGDVFDSSFARGQPAAFPLDEVIPGWTEVMQLMRPGDEWVVWIPPVLGYGEEAKGPIPANSVLQFRIQLLGVLPHGQ
jgi:peptidylprolyl isomerase/FKBP-type peptidyl-prolyl cis-trans isomerase FklB